jgi:glycosyltransferase involved in cell wall biosynthesis
MPGHIRYVEDHELNFIRNNADLYVFPSLKEGFSLTPLEAQYVGLPCVISDIPCHREVFGESVQYFDPLSVDDMAAKIYEVLVDNNKWSRLRELGYAQVKKYDWLKTAEITLNVFRDVLQGK